MKKNTLLLGLFMAVTPLMAQSVQEFVLRGSLRGLPDSIKVRLVDTEGGEEERVLAESGVSSGEFTLTGSVPNTKLCELLFMKNNPKFGSYVPVVRLRTAVENVPMTFSSSVDYDSLCHADYSQKQEKLVSIDGGKAMKELNEYLNAVREPEFAAKQAGYKAASKYFETTDNPDTMRIYNALEKAAEQKFDEANMNFVKSHPDYFISAWLVNKKLETFFEYTADEINSMTSLVASCPDTARMSRVKKYQTRALKYARMMAYKDFEALTPSKEAKSLSSLIAPGRYMLIDFWASWCGPCRAAIPKVKALYEKYAGRFDVCSVSVDEKEDAWRKAMEAEKMPWTQMWVEGDRAVKACTAYAVQTIPRLVLIDGEGRIVLVTHDPDAIAEALKNGLEG